LRVKNVNYIKEGGNLKKILSAVFTVLVLTAAANAFPRQFIILYTDPVFCGNSEMDDYLAPQFTVNFSDSAVANGAGVEYCFTFNGFFCAGAGFNYSFKNYSFIDLSNDNVDFTYNMSEPYLSARFYAPVFEKCDIYAGASGGLAIMTGSDLKLNSAITDSFSGLTPSFKVFAGFSGIINESVIYGIDAGYKFCQFGPFDYSRGSSSGIWTNLDVSNARSDFGGFYLEVYVGLGFGDNQ